MRAFDPRRVGRLECDAWVSYYRRRWPAFLRAAIGLTGHTFGLGPRHTLHGAWLVLRANQLWAPHPDNDPEGARRCMRRFYALVAARHGESFDVGEAARLEGEWWGVACGEGRASVSRVGGCPRRLRARPPGRPPRPPRRRARRALRARLRRSGR